MRGGLRVISQNRKKQDRGKGGRLYGVGLRGEGRRALLHGTDGVRGVGVWGRGGLYYSP